MTPEEIAATLPPPTAEQTKMVEALGVPTPIEEAPAVDPSAPVFNEAALSVKKYNSEFRIMETVMTLSQLGLTRKPEYRTARAVMFCRSDSYDPKSALLFLKGTLQMGTDNPLHNTGNCSKITEAGINRAIDIIEIKRSFTPAWFVGLLHEPSLAKEPKNRKYHIESVLGSTIIELARLAPMNPTLRSHLTAIFRTPPPPEADTYEKLKDWMEFEFEPPYFEGLRKQYYGINPPIQRLGAVDPARAAAFDIKVKLTGKQIGTCRYVADASKEVMVTIAKNAMTQWVRDGYSVDDMVANALDRGHATAGSSFDAAETANHVYSDHVFEDVEGITRNFDEPVIKQQIVDYLRRTYGTQEAQTIIERGT